jgi:hypothetical protein
MIKRYHSRPTKICFAVSLVSECNGMMIPFGIRSSLCCFVARSTVSSPSPSSIEAVVIVAVTVGTVIIIVVVVVAGVDGRSPLVRVQMVRSPLLHQKSGNGWPPRSIRSSRCSTGAATFFDSSAGMSRLRRGIVSKSRGPFSS